MRLCVEAAHSVKVCPVQEAKTTLARLYQRFTFELEPGQVPLEIRNTITISPKHGVHVRALPRTMQREP